MEESEIEERTPESMAGHLLIAEPELRDPNFSRAVVLILYHNPEGAFGIVLNRRSEAVLSDIIDGFDTEPAGDIPVHVGGPVQPQYFFAIHSDKAPRIAVSEHAIQPVAGVTFEPDIRAVVDYLQGPWPKIPVDDRPHVFVVAGYAGWGEGQLDRELADHAWITTPATEGLVFYPDVGRLWEAALEQKGGLYRIIARTGFRPSMN